MSNPPDPPPNQPQTPSRNNKRTGAFVAIAAIVVISLIVGLLSGNALLGSGLIAVPVVSLACVILGSILTISERTRQFAVGFLITGAILLFVSAGVCAVLVIAFTGQL